MPSNAPKGKLLMTQLSKRLVGIAASTILLSLVSAAANAQTSFHNVFNGSKQVTDNYIESFYRFQKPMILNSIGFYTNGESMRQTTYAVVLNNIYGPFVDVEPAPEVDIHGFRWYEIPGGLSMPAGSALSVFTQGPSFRFYDEDGNELYELTNEYTHLKRTEQPYNFSVQEISWHGTNNDVNYTNSNIRVTNPSANVAPEPGSFALALTGGAALLGICIRRRRNAG
jgi:hypothetical protein